MTISGNSSNQDKSNEPVCGSPQSSNDKEDNEDGWDDWNFVSADHGDTSSDRVSNPSSTASAADGPTQSNSIGPTQLPDDEITKKGTARKRVASCPTIVGYEVIAANREEYSKDDDNDVNGRHISASGIAGAVLGMLIGGPVVAAVFGGATVWAATSSTNAAGDVARSLGDVALYAADRFSELDKKHGVSGRIKDVATNCADDFKDLREDSRDGARLVLMGLRDRARRIDDKAHVANRINVAADSVRHFATRMNEEHRIVEKTTWAWEGVKNFLSCQLFDDMEEEEKVEREFREGLGDLRLRLEKSAKAD